MGAWFLTSLVYDYAMSKEFEYKIEYEVDKKSGRIVATIPELNHVSSYGANFAEAESNVREAALGYLELLTMKNLKAPCIV